jgi:transposase
MLSAQRGGGASQPSGLKATPNGSLPTAMLAMTALSKLAAPRASTTRRCARYVLRRLLIGRTTISAIAAELGVSWHTVSTIAMRTTADLVAAAGADRLAGVRVIGVDEHRWAPRRIGPGGFVTLIIDLTPTHDQTGPARLLDMVTGRSASALATWLAAQPASFAQSVEVIAMDGFAGYKTAAANVVPDAVTVMDPFHVVALTGAKLDLIRNVFSSRPSGGAATPATRSMGSGASPEPAHTCSRRRGRSRRRNSAIGACATVQISGVSRHTDSGNRAARYLTPDGGASGVNTGDGRTRRLSQ